MHILRRENHRVSRWKNGGGETAGIAVFPENAGLDDFDWRISMATVASDGPFSAFPDIDRTLSVLQGEGIMLEVDGRETELTPGSTPFTFAADATSSARLLGGTIIDLNVMTRRGRFKHAVERREVAGVLEVAAGSMVFAASEGLRVEDRTSETDLGLFDMIVPEGERVRVVGHGLVYLIKIEKL